MGKGSKQRPTDKKKFDDNFDRIFGSKRCHTRPQNHAQAQAADSTQPPKADVKTTNVKHG